MKTYLWIVTALVLGATYYSGHAFEEVKGWYWFHIHLQITLTAGGLFLAISLVSKTRMPIALATLELLAFSVILLGYARHAELISITFWYTNLETIIETIALLQAVTLLLGFPDALRRISKYLRVGYFLQHSAFGGSYRDMAQGK